jgi:thiol-disulfide isomerase/thioredoxin
MMPRNSSLARQTAAVASRLVGLLLFHQSAIEAFKISCLRPQIHTHTKTFLNSVSQRQTFILDGGELESFFLHNNEESSTGAANSVRSSKVGSITLVTGSTQEDPSRRIIAVQASNRNDDNTNYDTVSLGDVDVYEHTIATIPQRVSENDALSTAAAALVGIHCAIPKVGGVGGSGNDIFYSGKAVVVGGNDYACFVADGLATLGIEVSIVTTGSVKVKNEEVNVMKPSEFNDDYDDIGFADAVGQFDSLVDTISNERKGMVFNDDNPFGGSSVLQLLQSRHQCSKYISTLTQAQQIVKKEGVLFGPGKANAHVKSMESAPLAKCKSLVPSLGFGSSTLQPLLDGNVLFSTKNSKPIVTRGWTMKDFWEETSWPRDSSGTGIRYGFPVQEEEDLDEVFRREQLRMQQRTRVGSVEGGGMDKEETTQQILIDQKNPYVTQIIGVDGLAQEVISKQKDCVVFVAMKSCRTCKGINPVFTKLARDRGGDNLMFAKADATGSIGKALGKQLGVVSVPSFVLFRNGVRYGAVATSKLPSDRLDQAIQDLVEGKDFDPSLEEDK